MALLPSNRSHIFAFETTTPYWLLRISNTRLAECIMDLCGVANKESLRSVVCTIFTRFTSQSPNCLSDYLQTKRKSGYKTANNMEENLKVLDEALGEATLNYGLSNSAAEKLRSFVLCCMPLPTDIDETIDVLKRAIIKLRSLDPSAAEPRRVKRFEDAAKSLRSLKDLLDALRFLKVESLISQHFVSNSKDGLSYPLYISLDLGLRQRRKHYHGGMIFQCISILDSFFMDIDPDEHNDSLLFSGRGIKIAEGGNFSDLVRTYRPPGNFTASFVNYYTTAPIPTCAGVRFAIGKMVELVYIDAAMQAKNISNEAWSADSHQRFSSDNKGIELLRSSLGHPTHSHDTVTCLVTSVHGMDAASAKERLLVASTLWRAGISAEYLAQSGVVLGLQKRLYDDATNPGGNPWSLAELFGVCRLVNIPFIVLVSPHILKDKGNVRLRRISTETFGQGSVGTTSNNSVSNEVVVALDDLVNTILEYSALSPEEEADEQIEYATGPSLSSREVRSTKETQVNCIYVDQDHYFGNDREISKDETPHWRNYWKSMKSVRFTAEAYLSTLQDRTSSAFGMHGLPVFAVADVSFWILRDFGTALMKRENEQSANGAADETIGRHPASKRVLKTLSIAIDNFMIRHGLWSGKQHSTKGSSNGTQESSVSCLTVLLYSKTDDRFDTLSLQCRNKSHQRNARRK